jgi:hypothetical protein
MRLSIATLIALGFVLAIFLGGCALAVSPQPPKIFTSALGGSLRLRDSAHGVDVSVRVIETKIIDRSEGPPSAGELRWLGVHLTIRNLSSVAYRNSFFYSRFYLVKSVKPATRMVPTTGGWSPVSGANMPAHTLTNSVTIVPGGVHDGWLWFWIEGKKSPVEAPDFRVFHVLSFDPAGGSSSVIGMWQLKP